MTSAYCEQEPLLTAVTKVRSIMSVLNWLRKSSLAMMVNSLRVDIDAVQNTSILFHVSCTTPGWHTQKNADLDHSELWMHLDSSPTRYGRCSFFSVCCGVGLLILFNYPKWLLFNYHNTMASLPGPPGKSYLSAEPSDWVLDSNCLPNPPKQYSDRLKYLKAHVANMML